MQLLSPINISSSLGMDSGKISLTTTLTPNSQNEHDRQLRSWRSSSEPLLWTTVSESVETVPLVALSTIFVSTLKRHVLYLTVDNSL